MCGVGSAGRTPARATAGAEPVPAAQPDRHALRRALGAVLAGVLAVGHPPTHLA